MTDKRDKVIKEKHGKPTVGQQQLDDPTLRELNDHILTLTDELAESKARQGDAFEEAFERGVAKGYEQAQEGFADRLHKCGNSVCNKGPLQDNQVVHLVGSKVFCCRFCALYGAD